MSENEELQDQAAIDAAAESDHETPLESVSELDEETQGILEAEGVDRDDSPPMLKLGHPEVTSQPIRIYLANASDAKAHWSLSYANTYLHGDQDPRSFNVMSVPYMPAYTVCYWTDPTTRSCAEIDASDCVVFTGDKAIRTVG